MFKGYYAKNFTEQSFWEKVGGFWKQAGARVIYPALLLYFMMQDSEVPFKIKTYIAAGLGYFILPTDVVPDLTPLIGFTDDLSVLLLVLSMLRENISDKHREQALDMLEKWFHEYDEQIIQSIENKLTH